MSSRRIWTQREDEVFRRIAADYQPKNWALIAKRLASQFNFKKRTGKQCRQRWYNHLDPSIEKKGWTKNDQELLLSLHKQFGSKWTIISEKMPGRSDNSIKNYFYSMIRRNLRRMGKLLGSKNSTGLMREIKPSTMTKIFGSLNDEEDETLCTYLAREGLSKEYLNESCQNIRIQIISFSYYKPKKNDRISNEQKYQYEKVFELLKKVNEIYEKVREEQKGQRTDKQLFRHYYQEMNREDSEEQQDSQEDLDVESEVKSEKKESKSTTRTSRGRQIKCPKIDMDSPSSPERSPAIRVLAPLSGPSCAQDIEKDREPLIDSSTLSRERRECGLASIVESAEEIEFHDPDFNIEINEELYKPAEQNMNNLQIDMSRMSFKSPACNFGTPTSRVNFFQSPRNVRVTCLTDYLMRLSSSMGIEGLDLSGSIKDQVNSGKKGFNE